MVRNSNFNLKRNTTKQDQTLISDSKISLFRTLHVLVLTVLNDFIECDFIECDFIKATRQRRGGLGVHERGYL